MTGLPRFYTVSDVVAATHLPRSTVWGLIEKKILPVFRPQGVRIVRIREQDFLDVVARYTNQPPD